MMNPQVGILRGTVRNTSPPNCTIKYWPIGIINIMVIKPGQAFKFLKAEPWVKNDLALNIFQNCNITKVVKKMESSYRESIPSV